MPAWILTAMIMAAPPVLLHSADLVEIAGGTERALVVRAARELEGHVVPLLNWVGLAFPEWAPGPQGVLAGARGAVRILDRGSREKVGLPEDAPLAILWPRHAPSPLLVVAGLSKDACRALGEALVGAAPPDARPWEKRGLCVVAVGECAVKRCNAVGLPAPGKKKVTGRDAVVRLLDRHPVVLAMEGKRFLGWLPAQARSGMDGLRAAWLGFTAGPGQRFESTAILERSQPWNRAGLQPVEVPGDAEPLRGVADVVAAPGGGFPLNARAEDALAAWWGPDLRAAWRELGITRVHATWKAVDPRAAGSADGDARAVVFALPGTLAVQCRAPGRIAQRADERLAAAGFERDVDAWVKEPWMVRVSSGESKILLETGADPPPSPVHAPRVVPDVPPLVVARWHGLRVVGEARRVPTVAGAASPELRGLLGLDLVAGPTLERMGASVLAVGTLPGNPRVLVATVVSDVRMR